MSVDVAKLIKKLEQEKVAGIILDLRRNPGGSLEEAIRFSGLFVKGGPIVLARSPEGRVSVDTDDDPGALYDGPLVVLVNRYSASASEIAAAALQDYGRALVVGDTSTFGKGTVQNLDQLLPFARPATESPTNDPGTVKITIRKFYRITGASTQFKGVVPDIILPDTLSYRTDANSERTLENALPFDTLSRDEIQQVNYTKLNLVQPHLALLHERSDARVATNQDFIYIRQDIAELKKLQGDKPIDEVHNRLPDTGRTQSVEPGGVATLNEREALQEREKIAAQNRARDEERAARTAPDETIYELTVENADDPGLPPPLEVTNTLAATGLPATGHNQVAPAVTSGPDSKFTNSFETNAATLATNSLSSAAAKKKPVPAIDPMLDETENILEDYISMLSKSNMLIASHPDL